MMYRLDGSKDLRASAFSIAPAVFMGRLATERTIKQTANASACLSSMYAERHCVTDSVRLSSAGQVLYVNEWTYRHIFTFR